MIEFLSSLLIALLINAFDEIKWSILIVGIHLNGFLKGLLSIDVVTEFYETNSEKIIQHRIFVLLQGALDMNFSRKKS